MKISTLTLTALFALMASNASASDWAYDEAHSQVGFSVRHAMMSNVRGTFNKVKGSVKVDDTDITKSQVVIEIEVASIDTRNEKRDGHLKSADFFNAEKYPTIVFKSTKIAKHNHGLKVTGDLTMHGVTKKVTMDVEGPQKPIKDPFGMTRSGLGAVAKINRKDFGLTWNQAIEAGGLLVGEEIAIQIDAEFIKSQMPPPTSH